MMMKQKKNLAVAVTVVATIGLGVSTSQAVNFTASGSVENTLAVTSISDFDLGVLFATANAASASDGVGALVIGPDGTTTDPSTDSASVQFINLGTPVGAQGSVDMAATFDLVLPDTSTVTATDFAANAGGTADTEITAGTTITELQHSSLNPSVPSLYLMHFTVGDVSGGAATEGTTNQGDFTVVPGFGQTTYVFNIGGTVTTKPFTSAQESYQAGVYSGSFTVTASY